MSASLEASLRLDIAQYQAQLAKARGEAKKFRDQLKGDSGGMGKNLFGGIGAGVSSLLPAASAAAIVGGVKSIMNEMDDLADTALRLNESTEVLQRVGYASKILAGVDLNGVTTSFLRLEKSIGDVENAAANKALERYGISAESLARLPLDQKMIVLAEAFQKARADGTGYNDLLSLLGKSAGDLIPLLEQSGQTLRDTFADAPVILDGTVQRMAAMNDQVDAFIAKQKGGITDFLGQGLMMVDEILDPNKTLGQNTRDAAAGADKTVADQQAKREAAAAALADATAKAQAAAAMKQQLATQSELNKISEKEAALSAKRFQDYLSILPPNLKLLELRRELMRLDEERGIQGPGLEEERIKNEERILAILGQVRGAEADVAEEKKRALDEAQKAAETATGQQGALADYQAELDIIRQQALGRKEKAAEMQKELDIQREAKRLMDETGLSQQKATELARQHSQLKDQLAAREAGGDGKIRGYSSKQGGADEARARAAARVTDSSDRVRAQKDKFQEHLGPRNPLAGRGDPTTNPLAAQAGKNAAAADPKDTGGPAAQAAQIVTQILPQLLSVLSGS